MKLLLKVLAVVLLVTLLIGGGGYYFVNQSGPTYDGKLTLKGLDAPVEVYFDTYAIPHIYGESETDAYYALGYVHAMERLFQMEMIRRVANGNLSEILGKDLLDTDKLFRTLSLHEKSIELAQDFRDHSDEPYVKSAMAYLAGINEFIASGPDPVEFSVLGIEKTPFTIENLFDITGYMTFGFAHGVRIDPIVDKTALKWGNEYLKDWVVHHHEGDQTIPVHPADTSSQTVDEPTFSALVAPLLDNLPIPLLVGSNSWVLAPQKSSSGSVIFANDPHIGYGQPSVWYEAHLEAPGLSVYGYHLAGNPFAPVVNTHRHAVGLTMLENDDTQFYREKINPDNPQQYMVKGEWENLAIRTETIKVKDQPDVNFEIRTTRHGPIVNDVFERIDPANTDPVALWWMYLHDPGNLMEAAYIMAHGEKIEDLREAASMIYAPGLNVMYGDEDGNIGWWAAAKLVQWPDHINSKVFLDGASGNDDPLGYLDFSQNPQSENPPSGYVYSANNQPDPISGDYYPGYYAPQDRAKRIVQLLEGQEKWSVEDIQKMIVDDVSPVAIAFLEDVLPLLKENLDSFNDREKASIQALSDWDGNHAIPSIAPTMYYKLKYRILYNALADEMGAEDFNRIVTTFLMKKTAPVLIANDSSLWWDNVATEETKETRKSIFIQAFQESMVELTTQLGPDIQQWNWGKVHTIEHGHVLGNQPPLNQAFNVGPFPIAGGNEVINNVGFSLNGSGLYPSTFGPSRRAIIDFSDIEKRSFSIIPTGQSGHVSSDYYADQAQMYLDGKFRRQLMNREEIEAAQIGKLVLQPKK